MSRVCTKAFSFIASYICLVGSEVEAEQVRKEGDVSVPIFLFQDYGHLFQRATAIPLSTRYIVRAKR